jgi:hypothetical protein
MTVVKSHFLMVIKIEMNILGLALYNFTMEQGALKM